MRILLIEDNPDDEFFLRRALEKELGQSFTLDYVETLGAGIDLASQQEYDVVLVDLGLPDSNGIETCQRAVAGMPNLPIIVMTGHDDGPLAKEALRTGAQDYLPKGKLNSDTITRVIVYSIERHQVQHELAAQAEELNLLLERIPAILWTADTEMRFTSSRGAALVQLGLQPDEIVGQTVADFFTSKPDVQNQIVEYHEEALKGQTVSFDIVWSSRHFEVQISPIQNSGGGMTGTVGVALDITETVKQRSEQQASRVVQQSLLPEKPPNFPGFDIYGKGWPAENVGGDWFDFHALSETRLQIAVGDVSGHGMPSALLACAGSALVSSMADQQFHLNQTLDSVSKFFHARGNHHLVVLMLLRIDAATRMLEYAAAGDQLLILSADGHLKHTLPASSLPAGTPDPEFEPPIQVQLEPGEVVLMLTDGFREVYSPTIYKDLFRTKRIVDVVRDNIHRSAQEILEAIYSAVDLFAEGLPAHDDRTGVVIKVAAE